MVLYYPELAALWRNLRAIERGVSHVVLVDNSASADIRQSIRDQLGEAMTYVDVGRNSGVAAGLNLGVQVAQAMGCDHVVLLDQDSTLSALSVCGLVARLRELRQAGLRVAGIGPDPVNARDSRRMGGPFRLRAGTIRGSVAQRREVITSGFVTSVATLDDVGPFREDLFIDYVDFEWCWRALSRGYMVGVETAIGMDHTLGTKDLRLLGVSIPLEAPIRNYYQFRNYLLVARLAHTPGYFLFRQALTLLARVALLPVLAGQRRSRIRYIVQGIRDGIRGLGGPAPAAGATEERTPLR